MITNLMIPWAQRAQRTSPVFLDTSIRAASADAENVHEALKANRKALCNTVSNVKKVKYFRPGGGVEGIPAEQLEMQGGELVGLKLVGVYLAPDTEAGRKWQRDNLSADFTARFSVLERVDLLRDDDKNHDVRQLLDWKGMGQRPCVWTRMGQEECRLEVDGGAVLRREVGQESHNAAGARGNFGWHRTAHQAVSPRVRQGGGGQQHGPDGVRGGVGERLLLRRPPHAADLHGGGGEVAIVGQGRPRDISR